MEIRADAVSVVIDGREIVHDVSLSCGPGTMTALVGPSGCGKTTLLHCLGLLQRPTSGRVLVDGTDTGGWNARARRRFWKESGAFVLQDYGVLEEESVAFNVVMKAGVFGSRVIGDQRKMKAVLELTGLTGRDEEQAAHLSGGEKQRLSIARALYKDARAVFVDEPTASLDEANRARVIHLLGDLARRGCVVIVATHDDSMMSACDVRYSLRAEEGVRTSRH
ncbi:ABC transporter ATP-binding protein [Amycolatopsis regifaucium]|uniref:ABC transporter ATP-binding protein n=1 Tax=Amycolatopsis regifaucium TaxID=546365 RepID=A0A154MY69_9PSEU|nr:ATP-binding cassette domain-containing protein [Amycolatopsis regifaucium]KZB88707.1 ABC transporter ATP-binding protein [Amycolatopsis regifaucium]OKA07121.1 ABC transporter ATP-binding protein [Amycolatopsis regifaucium]SFI57688.1 putative ABC transport system ATP-binding protein [Amycolatopsis regifaucium]